MSTVRTERVERLFKTLQSLVVIPATSGFEQGIASRLLDEMRPLADRVEVDPFGNVYGTIEGAGGPRVLLPAHSDSVGMIVSHIEENGYVRFDTVGSVPPNLAYAQRVLIMTPRGACTGVVGSKPGHIAFRDAPLGTSVPPTDALFIDVGASSCEAAQRMGIEPGQQVTWDRELAWLGDGSAGLVTGRSLDDKTGCLVLLEAMRAIRQSGRPHATLIFVGAVQEEIGLRGATQAANRVRPDLCIGVDCTVSQAGFGSGVGMHPSTTFSEAANSLGKGPGLSVMDRGASVPYGLFGHPALIALCRSVAERAGIQYQIEGSMPIITSDAAAVQFAGSGVPSLTIKIPSRYTHGPIEVCSLHDVAASADLLAAALTAIGPESRFEFLEVPRISA
ncbi:MAG TPA: M20/M25/M40 family metallo-hydrolase [Candidatus Baltobacteraceae bacterium]|nr:M20/M25/M40 family metallo-hydrolase [Candidatus Baltobacteraceae bacterium]